MQELVSIITPMYNAERFIANTIKSVLGQSYKKWEMIIIDDGSNDMSLDIVKNYSKKDNRIKVHSLKKNKGAGKARNIGIDMSRGRYIAFLDSDDLWYSFKLEKQLKFMMKNQYMFSFTSFDRINEDGIIINNKLIEAPNSLVYYDLLKTDYIGCLTVIYDRKYIGKIYMPEIVKGQDYCCWLSILKMNIKAYYLKEQCASYRVRRNSLSSNKIKAVLHQWNIYREIEKLRLFSSIYYLANYIYYAIKKRLI